MQIGKINKPLMNTIKKKRNNSEITNIRNKKDPKNVGKIKRILYIMLINI